MTRFARREIKTQALDFILCESQSARRRQPSIAAYQPRELLADFRASHGIFYTPPEAVRHSGEWRLTSREGRGTTVELWLPKMPPTTTLAAD